MSVTRTQRYDLDHMNVLDLSFAARLPHRSRKLADEEILFSAQQKPTRMFLVSEGCVRLVRPLRAGASAVMQRARVGDWLAESSLFSERYHCDAVAQGAASVISVSKRDLLDAFRQDSGRSLMFCELLAHHLRRLRGMHEIVRIRSAQDRLLQWLLLQASGNPATFHLDQTWTQVADEIALTREAVYRAVAELKRSGVLKQRGQTLRIDPSK
jgi:CRP-like cAMP-binding protein